MFLVTGATGNIGRELTGQLLDAGAEVRALTRDPSRARLPAAAEVVAGDLSDPAVIVTALTGADGAFLNVVGDPEPLVSALRTADVGRLVLVSSLCAATRSELSYADHFRHLEAAVQQVRPDVVVLRPGQFMSNVSTWAPMIAAGLVQAPFAEPALPVVDPADIAAVAATVLLAETDPAGQIYQLSGSERLTAADKVSILAQQLERPIRFEEQSEANFRAASAQVPAELVEYMVAMTGHPTPPELELFTTVADLTGREPGTFADWVQRHRDELLPA